ncbi:MAG: sigma-70 family RNA polymerase sigma factor [Pirellulaceae bacterium]
MTDDKQATEQLLAEARTGDARAIDQLLDRHRDKLRRMIDLRLDKQIAQRVDVSDIVQEVLVEVNRRLEDYLANPIMDFHLWIRQIAKDRIIDAHRRHRVSAKRSVDREQGLVARGPVDQSTVNLAAQLCDPELTPAAAATQQELALHVQSAVDRLDERNREIILMRHYEQLSNQDIAQALDLTEPAASMRYLRALKKLRGLLAGDTLLADHDLGDKDSRETGHDS